eukprot:TRINITY_DN10210_c0_g1_i2.p1 TRINITY_DN10210_c0_g1~~TRINITY_DN10210_c0_g1_i2.p1  ORF type:complete len:123 (-),score=26.34 TRINITY_DN10210_c0_g1_i2:25-393(-)
MVRHLVDSVALEEELRIERGRLGSSAFVLERRLLGKKEWTQRVEGSTRDLLKARVVYNVANEEMKASLEMVESPNQSHTLGISLGLAEKEWIAAEINDFLGLPQSVTPPPPQLQRRNSFGRY